MRIDLRVAWVAMTTSCTAGVVVTHILTKKSVSTQYEALIEEEVNKAKAFYSQRNKTGEFADPVTLAEKLVGETEEVDEEPENSPDDQDQYLEAKHGKAYIQYNRMADDYRGADIPKAVLTPTPGESMDSFEQRLIDQAHSDVKETMHAVEPETDWENEVVHQNVFDSHGESTHENLDRSNRDSSFPYIISSEEFNDADLDFNQNTLTYYEVDRVLVDERDQPLEVGTVGEHNLQFGNASGDQNIVYIRNHHLEVDFEICRSYGSYAVEVLGASPPRGRKGPG